MAYKEYSLLSKLLHAIAKKKNKNPTAGNILSIFAECNFYHNDHDKWIKFDAVNKWIKGNIRPQRERKKLLIGYINCILFDKTEKQNYIVKSLNESFDELPLDKELIDFVNDSFALKENNIFASGLVAPDYSFDPTNIKVMVETGKIPASYLYHTYYASKIWDKITRNAIDYPLYHECEMGLQNILQSEEWLDRRGGLNLVFNLGAGSASKDIRIIKSLDEVENKKPVFICVDTSFPMLDYTYRIVKEKKYQRIKYHSLITDFENPAGMKRCYTNRYFDLPSFDSKKAFFILGFTLSNINEVAFFKKYMEVCQKGDIFIFPMQFIPEEHKKQNLSEFKNQLRRNYDFEDGQRLAKEGLAYLKECEIIGYPKVKVNEIMLDDRSYSRNPTELSLSIDYYVKIKGQYGETRDLIISSSKRHYENVYKTMLEKLGYKIICSTKEFNNNVKTLFVEFEGN